MKKTHLARIGIASFCIAFSPASYAGLQQPAPVQVDLKNGIARGDLTSARNDAAPDVFIGCGASTQILNDGGQFSFGFCQAQDANEQKVFCITNDAALITAMNAINDTSYISFGFETDGQGSVLCTKVRASTQSFYLQDK